MRGHEPGGKNHSTEGSSVGGRPMKAELNGEQLQDGQRRRVPRLGERPARTIHPLARPSNHSGFVHGPDKFWSGDRIVVEGRMGWLDEALHDGDALVTFDDGEHETVKWRAIRHPL